MKASLAVAALLAAAAIALPAKADFLDVHFTATVGGDQPTTFYTTAGVTTANSGYTDGQTITGEFIYDTVAMNYRSFNLGSFSAALIDPVASETPAKDTAIYRSGAVGNGINAANNIQFTLAALSHFTAANAISQLTEATLQSELDFANSYAYLTNNTNAADPVVIAAVVDSLSVSVPEPASFGLLGIAFAGLIAFRRRAA